jgi:hypothetical protein
MALLFIDCSHDENLFNKVYQFIISKSIGDLKTNIKSILTEDQLKKVDDYTNSQTQ